MSAHAEFAPSSMHLTVNCHASHRIRKPYLNQPRTPEQMEGDAAHWLALEWQEGRRHGIGVKTPNGMEVTGPMVIGAELWVSVVPADAIGEIPVLAQRIHALCWGTPDARHRIDRQYTPGGCIIRLWDYKFGHRYVDPFEWWQGIPYLAGLIDEAIAQGYDEELILVEVCIVQPRSYDRGGPIQYWRHGDGRLLTAAELRAHINVVHMAVAEAEKPDAKAKVGSHCLDCEGRHACALLQASCNKLLEFSQETQRMDLSAEQLGVEAALIDDAMELLKARKTGLEVQLDSLLRVGYRIPHWGMEPGQSKLKWKVPVEEVFAFGDMAGYELRKPADAITATQARERYKLADATVNMYAERSPAAMKLTRTDLTQARKVFSK